MDKRHDIARELARRYGTLTTEQIETLASVLVSVSARRGQYILNEGDVCRNIYYVERGMVRLGYQKNGRELTEHIGYEGSIVMSIESLFQNVPSRLCIKAIEPSTLYAIPYDSLNQLCQTAYAFCRILMSIMQESLIESQHKADTLRYENAKERYLLTLRNHPSIIRRAPLHIVASYLQMTPETLSRVRTQINKEAGY